MYFIPPRIAQLFFVALLSGCLNAACATDLSRRSDLGPADIVLSPSEWRLSNVDDALLSATTGAERADEIANGKNTNHADISQIGDRNTARMAQSGAENVAIAVQIGDQNEIDLSQSGRGNRATIFQAGNAKASVTQVGTANNATVVQPANASKLTVWQYGDKTSFKLIQY
jgi:hypothetical protein